MTKSGGQFCISIPTPNSGGTRPLSPRDLRPWYILRLLTAVVTICWQCLLLHLE